MITRQEAARTAEFIIEYPADDPENGWTLDVFYQGWLVYWHGRDPLRFSIVIERENGLVRYFTHISPQQILNHYESVRHYGHPDDRWTTPWQQFRSNHHRPPAPLPA
jgi:hypothetical protein